MAKLILAVALVCAALVSAQDPNCNTDTAFTTTWNNFQTSCMLSGNMTTMLWQYQQIVLNNYVYLMDYPSGCDTAAEAVIACDASDSGASATNMATAQWVDWTY